MESIKNLNEVNIFEDFNLHESFRSYMIYEEITGENFKPTNLKSILIFFYANVMACNRDLACDFDAFVDWLDEHTTMVTTFTEWIMANVQRNMVKQKETTGEEAGKEEPFQNQ